MNNKRKLISEILLKTSVVFAIYMVMFYLLPIIFPKSISLIKVIYHIFYIGILSVPVLFVVGLIIAPIKKDEEKYKKKFIAKILFIVSAVLFILTPFVEEIFYEKLVYSTEGLLLYMWLIAISTFIAGFIVNPFRKSEEKDNNFIKILSIVNLVLCIIAFSMINLNFYYDYETIINIAWCISTILTIFLKLKYPNNIYVYISSSVGITSIVFHIAAYYAAVIGLLFW